MWQLRWKLNAESYPKDSRNTYLSSSLEIKNIKTNDGSLILTCTERDRAISFEPEHNGEYTASYFTEGKTVLKRDLELGYSVN